MKIHEPQEINNDEQLIKELTLLLEMSLSNLPRGNAFEKHFGKRIDHALETARGVRRDKPSKQVNDRQTPVSSKALGACCENEHRNWNGGCANCGAPCI